VLVNLAKVIFFGTLDALSLQLFLLAVVMGLCTVPGTWAGAWLVRRTSIKLHTAFRSADHHRRRIIDLGCGSRMIRLMRASDANRQILSEGETAFLDLREAGPFSEGHPLFAVPVPYSSLEARIGILVPRLSTPLILIDDGDGIADAGAEALASMGYRDIAILEGGAPAWVGAGLTLFKGVNVPSKTLGELAEARFHPKTIQPETLATWQREHQKVSFFDCRPPTEFRKMTVPGAACLPNGEIAHRLPALRPEEPIVITCAGRTRGIIGALSLAQIAPSREIYALENGTQGWALAGLDLERGSAPGALPELDGDKAGKTRVCAEAFLNEQKIPLVGVAEVLAFTGDETRTTYCFDLRSAAEAGADPLAAFAHVWSGQIVQATDRWVGVRHARLVLADDLGLRAALAAFWLRMLGFEVHVALIDDALRAIPKPDHPTYRLPPIAEIDAVAALSEAGTKKSRLFDLRPSQQFAAGHVLSSVWTIRPQLSRINVSERVLLIGDDGPEAELAATELLRLGHRNVALIRGGFSALRDAGAAIETGPPLPLAEAIDVTSFAHGRHDGDLAASKKYLDWEQGLVAALSADERRVFRI